MCSGCERVLRPHPDDPPTPRKMPLLRAVVWPSVQEEVPEWPSEPGTVKGGSVRQDGRGTLRALCCFVYLGAGQGPQRAGDLCFRGTWPWGPTVIPYSRGRAVNGRIALKLKINESCITVGEMDSVPVFLVHLQPVELRSRDKYLCVCTHIASIVSVLVYLP